MAGERRPSNVPVTASLAVGKSCQVNVAFRPKSSGTITGTVTITDNAWNSPQTISLTGTGTIVKLTPTSLGFPKASASAALLAHTKAAQAQGLSVG